jgi:CheY-like chemotaxis protein
MIPHSILIVEDEILLQDVYKLILSAHGYIVHTADNGVDGLNKLKKISPDLILLDVFMPVMNGLEFMRNVDMSNYPDTKIIVYSNLSDSSEVTEMIELGAHKFVLKSSMTPKDLINLITQQLA